YSARMDTAERGGVQETGSRRWMTAFHESDPAFTGTDTSKDPGDLDPKGHPSRLLNDMFPDDLLTPGTRIDLFYKARTGPLAPWRLEPDTSQAWFIEMEVLPSSTDGAGNQNRVLFVNMAPPAERDVITRDIEAGLAVALPGGSPNAGNTSWDRFDLPDLFTTPRGVTTDFANQDEFRLTERILAGYDQIIWNNASGVIQQADARLLLDWLTCYTGVDQCEFGCGRGLYLTGDNLAASMASGDARQLLDRCGVGAVCGSYRSANCPAGTPVDQARCVPVESSGIGAHFDGGFAGSLVAPSPLSPQVPCLTAGGSFDVLTDSGAEASSASNLVFNGAKGLVHDASVSAIHWYPIGGFCFPTGEIGGYHKSVVDGFSLHRLRTPGCGSLAAIGDRLTKVTTWLDQPETYTSGVPGPGEAPPVAVALLPAVPNPMRSGSGSRLTMELPGPLASRLTIHDLSGRLVRVLHDGPAPVGRSDHWWDGLDATGAPVPSGIYFARLGAGGQSVSRRIVVAN
ncbi:MAG: peptidase S8/S53 subtilisin kexin sedolisin, partial [bacterium]